MCVLRKMDSKKRGKREKRWKKEGESMNEITLIDVESDIYGYV